MHAGLCHALFMVTHKAHQKPAPFGEGTRYTTLCNRMNAGCADGMNCSDVDAEVTCKFCLRLMARPKRPARAVQG